MTRWTGLALPMILVTVAGLRADEPKAVEGDLKALQGAWTSVGAAGDESHWTINGDEVKVVAPSRTYTTKAKLDRQAKPEPTIDFLIVEAPEDAKGKTSLGIYKVEGDALTICIGGMEGFRPTTFEPEEGKSYVFKLKRDHPNK